MGWGAGVPVAPGFGAVGWGAGVPRLGRFCPGWGGGAAFLHQLEALHHAEAVLFVHDDQAQIVELDLLLDQRVRADHQVRAALGDMTPRAALAVFFL